MSEMLNFCYKSVTTPVICRSLIPQDSQICQVYIQYTFHISCVLRAGISWVATSCRRAGTGRGCAGAPYLSTIFWPMNQCSEAGSPELHTPKIGPREAALFPIKSGAQRSWKSRTSVVVIFGSKTSESWKKIFLQKLYTVYCIQYTSCKYLTLSKISCII